MPHIIEKSLLTSVFWRYMILENSSSWFFYLHAPRGFDFSQSCTITVLHLRKMGIWKERWYIYVTPDGSLSKMLNPLFARIMSPVFDISKTPQWSTMAASEMEPLDQYQNHSKRNDSSNDFGIDLLHFNWEGIPTVFNTSSKKISWSGATYVLKILIL